ncbi:Uncharacterised protein [Serratia fonticola]|uniref:Uncharacterized protein n=1 Tax=Serratia fonticola TaxID=47917 RepID=A0A4U9TGJ6_SERFO|nr:Uncharacterised protein [Serratia fonticola]
MTATLPGYSVRLFFTIGDDIEAFRRVFVVHQLHDILTIRGQWQIVLVAGQLYDAAIHARGQHAFIFQAGIDNDP